MQGVFTDIRSISLQSPLFTALHSLGTKHASPRSPQNRSYVTNWTYTVQHVTLQYIYVEEPGSSANFHIRRPSCKSSSTLAFSPPLLRAILYLHTFLPIPVRPPNSLPTFKPLELPYLGFVLCLFQCLLTRSPRCLSMWC